MPELTDKQREEIIQTIQRQHDLYRTNPDALMDEIRATYNPFIEMIDASIYEGIAKAERKSRQRRPRPAR